MKIEMSTTWVGDAVGGIWHLRVVSIFPDAFRLNMICEEI